MSSWNQIIPVLSGLALEEFISGHALVGDVKMNWIMCLNSGYILLRLMLEQTSNLKHWVCNSYCTRSTHLCYRCDWYFKRIVHQKMNFLYSASEFFEECWQSNSWW